MARRQRRCACPLFGAGLLIHLCVLADRVHAGGGDTCDTATLVGALPFIDAGDTGPAANDYAAACPFGSSLDSAAPDVVYQYTPQRDEAVTISTCGSAYDTKLYVFEGSCPIAPDAGTPIACSDDDCFGTQGRTGAAHLDRLPLRAGITYYIVVDGFKTEHGQYRLAITSSFCAECDPDATREIEPNCGLGDDGHAEDFVNGGCNSDPPFFWPIESDETVCGTSASNPVTGARDTDWYELLITEESVVTWEVAAEFRALVGIIDTQGVPDCTFFSPCFVAFTEASSCQPGSVSALLPAGTWWFYVAPFFQDAGQCSVRYTATAFVRKPGDLDGDGVVGPRDLVIFLNMVWGPCPPTPPACAGDINGDGTTNVLDLILLLLNWTLKAT